MHRHGSVWSEIDDDQLRCLIESGHSASDVASHLGRTLDAVQGRASRLGFSWKKAQAAPHPTRNRFVRRVHFAENGCHLWTGQKYPNGYGQFALGNRHHLAHRFAWEMEHGKITSGLFVCHHCDNKSCVNTDHMFLGTHADNMADMIEKGRRAKWHIIPDETITAIRSAVGTQGAIARRYGVSQSYVSMVKAGKYRKEASA